MFIVENAFNDDDLQDTFAHTHIHAFSVSFSSIIAYNLSPKVSYRKDLEAKRQLLPTDIIHLNHVDEGGETSEPALIRNRQVITSPCNGPMRHDKLD